MGALDRLSSFEPTRNNINTTGQSTTDFFTIAQNYGFIMYDENGNPTELCKVLQTDGNNYIQAIAGSGKTTALVLKVLYDVYKGELLKKQTLENGMQVTIMDKVFVGTFLKSGADELKRSIVKMQEKLGIDVGSTQINTQISFGTLHAEFKRALNEMGVKTPIGSSDTLFKLFKKAVDKNGIHGSNGKKLSNEEYKTIESVLIYYRGRIDNKRADHPSAKEFGLTISRLEGLANTYKNLKEARGVMDFEDLQELLYTYCYVKPTPAVIEFLASRYNYMYLDEFQDTSQIQYALLRVYMRDVSKQAVNRKVGKITVVGDVQQCIYSFRGSDINVMYRYFDNDFNSTHNNLSYNRRCPDAILAPIVPSISKNAESVGITIKALNTGGEFHCYSYDTTKEMLVELKDKVEEDIKNGLSVAILCRTNYDGVVPASYIGLNNIGVFSVSNESMTLKGALVNDLRNVTLLFNARGGDGIKKALSLFTPLYEQQKVAELCKTLKQNNKMIWDIPIKDVKYSCPMLSKFVEQWFTLRKVSDDIGVLKAMYWELHDEVFGKSDSAYAIGAVAILDLFLFMLNNNNYNSVSEFRDDIDLLDEKLSACVKSKRAKLIVSTVHEFKGKEADSVYVWNDNRGVFPSQKTNVAIKEELEEERRVHYIACTRARKKQTIMTLSGRVSMFVKEMNCKIENRSKNKIQNSTNTGVTIAQSVNQQTVNNNSNNSLQVTVSDAKVLPLV